MNPATIILVLLTAAFPLSGAETTAASENISPHIRDALTVAPDASKPEKERLVAIRRLGTADYEVAANPLFNLLDRQQPEAIRLAVIGAFEELAQPAAVVPLLAGWTNYPPALKQRVLHALTSRRELVGEFIAQLEKQTLPIAEVDSATRQRLMNFPDDNLASQARKLFGRQPWLDARAALERFRPALALKGDATRGREVFKERTCVNCHRIGDEGWFVGADLFTIKDMPRDELLQQIVAPNLFFMPNFQAFMAEAADGEIIEGVMAGTTEQTVTLRAALGTDRVLNRASLKRLKGLNVSLMPEGLLEGLTPQQVADLLAFIQSLRGF